MKFFAALFILSLTINAAVAQVKWDEKKPLTWHDFANGDAHTDNKYDAVTSCYTTYTFLHDRTADGFTLSFTINSWFDVTRSWVKSGKKSKPTLKHEQLHFDIHELYARKLMIAFNDHKYTANYNNEARAIYDSVANEEHQMQVRYDTQSNHSIVPGGQAEWDVVIHEQLKKTPKYN